MVMSNMISVQHRGSHLPTSLTDPLLPTSLPCLSCSSSGRDTEATCKPHLSIHAGRKPRN